MRERAGLKPGTELNLEYRDGKIEVEPVRQHARLVRRGSRHVLAAPAGAPSLTNEQVNRIIEEVRDERVGQGSASRR
jgi:bifunctional DNA-binding transcriptional regulator/antitoxin component of YhaV-PrlF toxin-antitoxin module